MADFLIWEGILGHLVLSSSMHYSLTQDHIMPSLMNTSSQNSLLFQWLVQSFFSFEFHLRVSLNGHGHLILISRVRNVSGEPFSFSTGFHTYFSVSDIRYGKFLVQMGLFSLMIIFCENLAAPSRLFKLAVYYFIFISKSSHT